MEGLLAIVRAVHFAATIVLFGEIGFAIVLSGRRERPPRFAAVAGSSVAIALASAIGWFILEAQQMSGLPLREALSGETLGTVVSGTLFGKIWIVRALLLAALAAVLMTRARVTGWPAFVAASLVLALLAGTGHAAAGRGLDLAVRLGVDGLHLLAAGAWVGSLVPFFMLMDESIRRADPDSLDRAREATRRFSVLGVASVGTLVLTGFANTAYRLPDAAALYDSTYGRLLLAKLALFAAMIAFAAVNRLSLTPRLASAAAPAALRALRRNAIAEFVLGFAIACIVGELGITMPPMPPAAMHMH